MATYIFITSLCFAVIVLGLVIFKPHLKNNGSVKEINSQKKDRGQMASKYRGVYIIND